MKRGPDAGTALCRALTTASRTAGCPAIVRLVATSPYASATFDGTQLRLMLAAPAGAALDQWLRALPEAEIAMPGHVAAGIFVAGDVRTGSVAQVTLEALVLVRD